MTQEPHPRLRIAAINFLNPAPLLWDFEHSPTRGQLASRYDVTYTLPSGCAAQLASGEADLGLIPIAAMPGIPGLAAVPGCVIASLHEVRSIQLICKVPVQDIRTLAADNASRSSLAYVQILLRQQYGIAPALLPSDANVESMLLHADAALVIGDPALLALEDRSSIEDRLHQPLLWLDIAAEWRRMTHLPWVAAVWALRTEALTRTGITAAQLTHDLQTSRDHGLANIAALVQQWAPQLNLPAEVVHHYLTRNIHYMLDRDCLTAIDRFYSLAAECNLLPHYQLPLLDLSSTL